jgi:hypothetical protein
VGKDRVRKLMQQHGIKAKTKRKFVVTTDSRHSLQRLGAMVHALDVGGTATPEAGGFEAVLAGARKRWPDDDALLADVGGVLDSLHAHFSANRKP